MSALRCSRGLDDINDGFAKSVSAPVTPPSISSRSKSSNSSSSESSSSGASAKTFAAIFATTRVARSDGVVSGAWWYFPERVNAGRITPVSFVLSTAFVLADGVGGGAARGSCSAAEASSSSASDVETWTSPTSLTNRIPEPSLFVPDSSGP